MKGWLGIGMLLAVLLAGCSDQKERYQVSVYGWTHSYPAIFLPMGMKPVKDEFRITNTGAVVTIWFESVEGVK